jgi:hypothetical protein
MDRRARFSIAQAIVERTRDYTKEALNDLFRTMDCIEERHGLIPKLTEEEETAVAAAEEKRARGEKLATLEIRGPIENFLPEPNESVLARLATLPIVEQDDIIAMVALLIDIDVPPLRLSPEQIADLRCSLKDAEERGVDDAASEDVEAFFARLRGGRAED